MLMVAFVLRMELSGNLIGSGKVRDCIKNITELGKDLNFQIKISALSRYYFLQTIEYRY